MPDVRKDLSAPLLLSVRRDTSATTVRKAMSYPFSQQEVLAEAQFESSGSAFEAFSVAAKRLAPVDITELIDGARAVEAARASGYKRIRPTELIVNSEGTSWQQVAVCMGEVPSGKSS